MGVFASAKPVSTIRFAPRPKLSLKGSLAGSPVGLAPPIPANEPACTCGLGLEWSRKTFQPVISSSFFIVGVLLARSWRLLDRFWRARGGSWGRLGGSWAVLGASWGLLDRSWPALSASWGRLGASWTALGASWGPLGPPLRPSGRVLGHPWGLWTPQSETRKFLEKQQPLEGCGGAGGCRVEPGGRGFRGVYLR